MWKASARVTNFHSISCRRTVYCKKSNLCSGKLNKRPGQTSGVRPFTNGVAEGSGGSGAGKVILGTTLLTTGTVVGGIYYASIDSKFRQTVEDKVPYSSPLFNAILGKHKPPQVKTPKKPAPSPVKKSYENNLLPAIADKTSPVVLGEEKPVKIIPPVVKNIPATVSSVDQVGISSVDLDISKAVEKGISSSKKEASSTLAQEESDVTKREVSKDKVSKVVVSKNKVSKDVVETESKCSECEMGKEQKAGEDTKPCVDQKEVIAEGQKDASAPDSKLDSAAELNAINIVLNTALASVTEFGLKAIDMHERADAAVHRHRDSVKEALERFEKDGASKEDWDLLSKLSETKTQAIDEAERVGEKLVDRVDKMQRHITDAKERGLDASAAFASETLAKLTYALQQVKNRLADSQAEGSVLKEFQEFIKEGKENLAKELAAIRPEFEIDTLKANVDGALLAYAQKRIRLLEDTLHEREKHEGKLLQEALGKQQREHDKLAAMKLSHELGKLKTELNSLVMQKEAEEAERHENDLRTQLRRQAAALSDHLTDVLKVQETELNTKHGGELRENLLLARQEFELKLRGALARLNGIISAIRNKADTEKHNVEAQELWLACHSLSTAIIGLGDDRSRPYPIHSEVEKIRRVTNGNKVVDKVLDSLSDDVLRRGVFTEETLRRRFPSVKRVCKQVAMVGEDGGGVWSYMLSYLQSLFVLETRAAVTTPASIDPDELDTHTILSLATYALENGDTEQAVRYMNQLRGEPRRIAKDWIREARLFLEAKQAARFLTSFASAYNIGVEQHK